MTQEAFILPLADGVEPAENEQAQVGGGTGEFLPVGPGGTGGGSAPVIDNFDPPVGTPLNRDTVVSFDVTDDTGLLRGEVFVTLGGDTFVVHDGDKFRGRFSNFSSRTTIPDGFRYNVRPNGGWTEAPTFEVHAVDTAGQEAT